MAARYLIPDEPRSSSLSHLAVNPVWPLFAQMFCGSWLALPWFVFNGFALGSPSLRREVVAASASALGSFGLIHFLAYSAHLHWLQGVNLKLTLLSVIALKISMAYALCLLQSRSFELWRYFGGLPKSALPVLVVGFLLKEPVLKILDHIPLLSIALG